jgi:hypothetical protein
MSARNCRVAKLFNALKALSVTHVLRVLNLASGGISVKAEIALRLLDSQPRVL